MRAREFVREATKDWSPSYYIQLIDIEEIAEAYAESRLAELEQGCKFGWMDSITFEHELGEALGGRKVFADEEDLRKHYKCLDQGEAGDPYICRAMRVAVLPAVLLSRELPPGGRDPRDLGPKEMELKQKGTPEAE